MKNGYCVQCGRMYDAPTVEDGLCPTCLADEQTNDPVPFDDEDFPRWKYSKTAMRERLGVTGNRDE